MEGEEEYEIADILDSRLYRGKLQYLIDWKGFGPEERSWEPVAHLHAPELLAQFHLRYPNKPKVSVPRAPRRRRRYGRRDSVVGDKSEDPRAHRLVEGSDSEEEDNVPVGPPEGEEPPQLPTASIAPGVNRLDNELPRSFVGTSEKSAHTILSEEDEPVPTLNPVERRQLKRAEQKRYSLRAREKGVPSKPP